MKKYLLGAVLFLGILISPALTQAAGLTTNQANTLIAVVQSSPGTPASSFVNLITAFSNITIAQAESLITVVQSAPGAPASSFVNLLIAFAGDTSSQPELPTPQPTTPTTTKSLSVSSGSADPASANVVAGSTGNYIGRFDFTANGSSYTVSKVTVMVPFASIYSISTLTLKYKDRNGTEQRAIAPINASTGEAVFSGLSFFVPLNNSRPLQVYVDVPSISSGATSGTRIRVTLAGGQNPGSFEAVDQSGTVLTVINRGVGVDAPGFFTVRKSVPSFAAVPLGSTTLSAGANQVIGRFNIAASSAGDVSWNKLAFSVDGSANTAVNSLSLYRGSTQVPGNFSVNGKSAVFSPTSEQTISAGSSVTYELRGTVMLGAGANTLTVSIANPSTAASTGTFANVSGSTGASPSFVWSDWSDTVDHAATPTGASTTDWTNDYLVKGLPLTIGSLAAIGETVTPLPTVSVPTVEFVGTPTLLLQYDSAGKEANLVARASIRVTAGNTPVSADSLAQVLRFYKVGSGYAGTMSTRYGALNMTSSGMTIPANSSATFAINNTAPTKELFAGSYSLGLISFSYQTNGTYQSIPFTSFKNVTSNSDGTIIASSNPITIVGEVSPYISSVTSDSYGTIIVNGARLGLSGNTAIIDGSKVVNASKGDDATIMFGASSYGLTNGGHYLQITNPTVGNSNTYYFTLNMTAPTIAQTISSVSIIGGMASYTAGQTIRFSVNALAADGKAAGPNRGFNVQSSMRMLDPTYSYLPVSVNGTAQSFNATYNQSTSYWDITMTAPSDTTKTYDIDTAAYCANSSLGCSSGQINKHFQFTLPAPAVQAITVTYPNGGQTLANGQSYGITWTGGGSAIDVYLLDNTSRLGKKIFSGISNTHYVSWTAAPLSSNDLYDGKTGTYATPSGQYVIWIGCTDNSCIVDDSDSPFTISPAQAVTPTVTVTSPNGNQWQSGSYQAISWTDSAYTSGVYYTVHATQRNGSGYGIIADNVYGTSVGWTVGRLANGSSLPPLASGETSYYIQIVRQTAPTANSSNSPFTVIMPIPAPTATISATNSGNNATIRWSSTNAAECSLYDSPGDYIIKTGSVVSSRPGFTGNFTSGSLTATGNTTYSYGCTSATGDTGWKAVRTYTYTAGTETPVPYSQSPKCACDVSQARDCATTFVSTDQGAACYEIYDSQTDPLGGPAYMSVTYTRGGSLGLGGISQTASVLNALFSAKGSGGTAPAPSARFGYEWTANFGYGSTNVADVGALQIALSQEGVYASDVTGGFYSQTYTAVQAFQQKYGIDATGYVGALTRAKLNTLYAK